jgi:SAM-dependent methyltransferase
MPGSTLGAKVKSQMNRLDIHDVWEATYRTPGNERLFEQCYDYIAETVGQPRGSRALDIGGGIGANSVRLARRGYQVESCDYSEPILERAHANVNRQGLADRIAISRQDITDLTFSDGSFDLTLCWGVLMHIPDVDDALSQLVRVTKPGGYLVFEEVNLRSPEAWLNRVYWRALSALRKKKIRGVGTEAGVEHSVDFRGEKLFWRQIRLAWLIQQLANRHCRLVDARAGMFTELHLPLPRLLQTPFDAWNRFYQRNLGWTSAAKHSILIFAKS